MARQQRKQMDAETIKKLKTYVRYDEGAMLYSMGLHTFQDLAKEAHATRKLKGITLVNLDILNEFIETMAA